MSNLPALRSVGEFATSSTQRRTVREIARAKAYGATVTAQEAAKLEAIASVTETAMLATAHVSAIESLLITQAPHAEQRLRHLADAGCAGMASVVLGVGRRMA
jgi:hypothetical protein